MKTQLSYLLLFVFAGYTCIAQNEMEANNNKVDTTIVWNTKGKDWKLNKDKLVLSLTRENDSTFTIVLANNSKDTLCIFNHNSKLMMIQEAKDKNGAWKPIEYYSDSGCGHDKWFSTLNPTQGLKTKSKAYQGNFKTTVRFKLLANNVAYYSNSITGMIDEKQFELTKKAKMNSLYNVAKKYAGEKIAYDVIFIEPNGMENYMEEQKKFNEAYKSRK